MHGTHRGVISRVHWHGSSTVDHGYNFATKTQPLFSTALTVTFYQEDHFIVKNQNGKGIIIANTIIQIQLVSNLLLVAPLNAIAVSFDDFDAQ